MARSHARFELALFSPDRDPDLAALSKDAKLLYVVIVTDPALNHAGVVLLRTGVWAEEASLDDEELDRAFDELQKTHFTVVDRRTSELLVRSFIRSDKVAEQPNVLKGALSQAQQTRSRPLRRALAAELRRLPPPPPPKIGKNGRPVSYPDPHACAALLDPDGPGPGARNPSPNPSGNPLPNPSGNPSANPSSGTLPGTLDRRDAGTPGGSGRGRGEGSVGTSSSSVAPRKRGTRIPEDFAKTHITPELVAWTRDRCPDVDGPRETERFVLWAESASGQKGTKLDWVKAWKNWLLEEQKRTEQRRPVNLRAVPAPKPLPGDPAEAFAELRRRAAAPEAARYLGISCLIEPQPPSDHRHPRQWEREQHLAWLDAHERQLVAAFTERNVG
jgi:hypothetical protein